MSGSHPEPGLLGRRTERAVLDRLLAEVRAGQSRVLVLRGEAGSGKSALLDYLHEQASGCRVARASGVESEMEIAFAGLHQLCTPMLGGLAGLPGPQRDALSAVFGPSTAEAPGRLLVGLAVLGLLSEVAEERPLVCLVDDAQWLDQASAQALAFVARRLLAESVALVFAVREPGEERSWRGLPALTIEGLSSVDARALLDSVTPGRLDERVRDRIVAETRGNPLALLELPQGLSAAELAGGFGLLDAPTLASRIERSFRRRLQSLPATTQRLLLAAAAEPIGEVTLLWRAADRLGVGADAAVPAETAGLIEFGARVRFRHPSLRAAVYQAAPLPDRREVHRALAAATDPGVDPDRRAWHRAHAAAGPDEDVAAELERSAAGAQGRGGVAAAAAFLQRSAELTPDPARRGARALAAARAKFAAAAPDAAYELLALAELGRLDELQRAELTRLRAQMAFAERRGSDALRLLLDAADRLAPLDPERARETYLEALGGAISVGRLGRGLTVPEAAAAARSAPPPPRPPRPLDLLLDGVATRLTEGYGAGVPPLRRAVDALQRHGGRSEADIMSWLPLAAIAPELWDDAAWHELTARAVGLAREAGTLATLPVALTYRAAVLVHAGEFGAAAGLIEEASAITAATGTAQLAQLEYISMVLAAWQGEETRARALIDAVISDATARGTGRVLGLAAYATAVLYNGVGGYEAALVGARRACEYEDLGFFGWSVAELIEAAARSGASDEAAMALGQLCERTSAAGSDWALGIQARSRALLSDGPAADALYLEAIDRLGRTGIAVHLARAHLLYGEWLRREQRRAAARDHLRAAHDMFVRFGAAAFAERARRELQATGETVRKRTADTRDLLTVQETQVARLAAEGHTNPEIGAQLFISPRTAEYHLRKVFSKLGISSRRQLRHHLTPA
jgi:DNA-binding CsgD family transcriptional regulator